MKGLRLYKEEKLCSETAISRLFAHRGAGVSSTLVYPLRLVYVKTPVAEGASARPARFLVSVPKKRLRHAVDRVRMRRVIREAYRLNRALLPVGADIEMAFVYVADGRLPYARVESAMRRVLSRLGGERRHDEAAADVQTDGGGQEAAGGEAGE
ncbi:MAG: ribonuclease P protein component [Duncaniella sp.]|nr:ribonuclease P protein component [Duncaniella sp.]